MRKSGILAHPTSFPSKYGIGDLGKGAYEFVDFLEKSGQKQVLEILHIKVFQLLPEIFILLVQIFLLKKDI